MRRGIDYQKSVAPFVLKFRLGAGSGHETHPVRVASLIIMRNLLVCPHVHTNHVRLGKESFK